MKFSRLIHCASLMLALSCRSPDSSKTKAEVETSENQDPAASQQPQAVFDAWKRHIEEETGGKRIQPDCMPTHFGPKPGTPSKGIVVLFHGFTACPQQYFDVSKKLVAEGFDVFLPLMPGQGRMPLNEKDKSGLAPDDLSDLPVNLDISRLNRTARRMNELGAAAKGIKVIGGLSGGGGLATGTAMEGKGIWDRAVFMAPFYSFRTALGPVTALMYQLYPAFKGDYGKTCKLERGTPGKRHGICSITVDAMRTMLDYGLTYATRANELRIPVQFVGAEDDGTISNKGMIAAAKDMKNASTCFFYKGVPHSMMSRYENLASDRAWMTSLENHLVAFISQGTRFPTDGISSEEKEPLCQVDLKPES